MRKISKKSAIKWGVIALIIVALGALAYTFLKPEEEKPSYLTAPVEVGDIENNVMASGKVKALNTVDVGAQVSGEVTNLYVEVGDEVKKGDSLVMLEAMKMQSPVYAPENGVIDAVEVEKGDIVKPGQILVYIA